MLKNLISTLLVTGATLLSVSALAQTPTLNSAPTLDSQSAAPIVPAAPELAASSYLLIDANSGAVLVEHNADEALPPASLLVDTSTRFEAPLSVRP